MPNQPSSGISESEVRRIAQELGIDPRALEEALDGAGVWRSSETGTIQSVERTLERVFDAELPEESYSVILDEFVPASTTFSPGMKIGGAMNYSSIAGMAQCNVSVSRRNGKTNLKVRSSAFLAVLPTFFPALVATAVSGALVWEEMSATALVKAIVHVLFTVAVWSGAIAGFRTLVRNSNRKVLELLDRASAGLAEAAASPRRMLERSAPQTASDEANVEAELHQGG